MIFIGGRRTEHHHLRSLLSIPFELIQAGLQKEIERAPETEIPREGPPPSILKNDRPGRGTFLTLKEKGVLSS